MKNKKRWVRLAINGQPTFIHTNKDSEGIKSYVKKLEEPHRIRITEPVEIFFDYGT